MKLKKMTIEFNRGTVVVGLMTDAAPYSVNSLSFLSKKKFYENMTYHRLVVPDVSGVHMPQCGDPQAKADGRNPTDGQGTAGYLFGDENAGIPVGKGVVFLTQAGDAAGPSRSATSRGPHDSQSPRLNAAGQGLCRRSAAAGRARRHSRRVECELLVEWSGVPAVCGAPVERARTASPQVTAGVWPRRADQRTV